MQCVICKHGQTQLGTTLVILHREGSIFIFKEVPADICQNCGEYYLSDDMTGYLLQQAQTP